MFSQSGHHHSQELLKSCLDITMQHAQLCICGLDVVQVLHSPGQTLQDNFSVKVSKFTEVPLSPGVDNQTPGKTDKKVSKSLIKTFKYVTNMLHFTPLSPVYKLTQLTINDHLIFHK
uniref:Uncharacterized protein n=1 Tax=Anabas testudineus TaxID=64144 RepID=A0A3Q1J3Y9_ANATE